MAASAAASAAEASEAASAVGGVGGGIGRGGGVAGSGCGRGGGGSGIVVVVSGDANLDGALQYEPETHGRPCRGLATGLHPCHTPFHVTRMHHIERMTPR